tara:strand:- start:25554 stop:28229 length:2676 start_codon:yes stop_codon:yes gene_type:complete
MSEGELNGFAGLQVCAGFVMNLSGNILDIEMPAQNTLSSLAALETGDDIDSIFPGLLALIVRESDLVEGSSVSFPARLDDKELIFNVRHYSGDALAYKLLIYPDDIGLRHIYKREKRFEFLSHSLYESSLDAIITIDGNSIILEFSRSAEILFGYSRDEVIGQNVADIVIPKDLRQAHHDGMVRFHVSGTGPVINTRVEVDAARRDGSLFPCELTIAPTVPHEGEIFFTATIRDISERRSKEEALEKARRIAEASNKSKSSFLAHMSHEIRSPLNAIIGCIDLLLDSAENNEQRTLMQTSLSAGQGLLGIIEDILDFSKIEAGQLNVSVSRFNLLELCEQVVEVIAIRAASKDIDISVCFDPTIPAEIATDQGFIRRILTNLLDNAVKFTDAGGVSLKVTCHHIETENHHADLLFEVADTGIGIPKDRQNELFKEFSQVDSSDSTQYGGTGLGLAICRKLAENLNGHISIESDSGQGCLARVIIPVDVSSTMSPSLSMAKSDSRSIFLCSRNERLQATVEDQASYLGLSCGNVSDLEAIPSILGDDILLIIDLASVGSLQSCLNTLTDYGVASRQTILYGRNLSAADTLLVGQAGYQSLLSRPFRPSAFVNRLMYPDQHAKLLSPVSSSEINVSNPKILLAEDNEANQLVAKTMLNRAGYQLDIVNNGEAAVLAVKGGTYSLVLMDLRMPVLDGLQATKIIRELDSGVASIPIVAMTANAFDSDKTRCRDAGMNDFLAKPVNRDELLTCMNRWLGDNTGQPLVQKSSGLDELSMTVSLDGDVVNQLLKDTSEEAVKMIMQMVIDELNKFNHEIRLIDIKDIDYHKLHDLAHACRGSCSYCGVTVMQQFCLRLEIAAGVKDDAQLKDLLASAEEVIKSGVKALKDFIAALQG